MRHLLMITLLLAPFAAARAEGQADPAIDAEQLSQDLIKNIDSWIGQVNGKLQSDKPVTDQDFDSIFGESFFSGSQDPIKELELAQKRINDKLGSHKQVNDKYGKWMEKKLSAADLKPEVVPDDEHITVNLKTPENAEDSMKINIEKSRIKLNYAQVETRQELKSDGTVEASSFTRRRSRVLAVPKGANPARYKVSAYKGGVSIIFDRLKKGKKRTEASK